MSWFGFGKNKAKKTLEERLRDLDIFTQTPPDSERLEDVSIKGSGRSIDIAEDRFIENAKSNRIKYIPKINNPKKNPNYFGGNRVDSYTITATGYRFKPII